MPLKIGQIVQYMRKIGSLIEIAQRFAMLPQPHRRVTVNLSNPQTSTMNIQQT
jgi:hypothetical protein